MFRRKKLTCYIILFYAILLYCIIIRCCRISRNLIIRLVGKRLFLEKWRKGILIEGLDFCAFVNFPRFVNNFVFVIGKL